MAQYDGKPGEQATLVDLKSRGFGREHTEAFGDVEDVRLDLVAPDSD